MHASGHAVGSWRDVIDAYVRFLGLPAFRGAHRDAVPGAAVPAKVAALLDELVERQVRSGGLPPAPGDLDTRHVEVLFGASANGTRRPGARTGREHLWHAFILARSDYTCAYCRRSAFAVFEAEGRTLRFELEHRVPRAQGGGDFDLANIVAACRSCNLMKGQLPEDIFMRELRSLAKAAHG